MTRKLPSKAQIRSYWSLRLWKGVGAKFDSPEECMEADYCFACGFDNFSTERAHIIPRCSGGGDGVANLHLLCPPCHRASEGITEREYWSWLERRNLADVLAELVIARHGIAAYLKEVTPKEEKHCGTHEGG